MLDAMALLLGAALTAGGFTAGRRLSPNRAAVLHELLDQQRQQALLLDSIQRDAAEQRQVQELMGQEQQQLADQLDDQIRTSHEGRERLHQAVDQLGREQTLLSARLEAFNQRLDVAAAVAEQLPQLDQKLEEMQRFIVQAAEQAKAQREEVRRPRPAMDTEALMAALQQSQAEFRRRQSGNDMPMPAGGL